MAQLFIILRDLSTGSESVEFRQDFFPLKVISLDIYVAQDIWKISGIRKTFFRSFSCVIL